MKLTFIIPFFNGGRYIEECLCSLFNQDIPEMEYEVIIVDDCSTDRDALTKIERFATAHPTIRIIHNGRNLRCGKSRNVGLLQAKGEYIWFVDQDDFIVPNCIEKTIFRCQNNNLDILYFDYRDINDDYTIDKKHGVVSQQSQVTTGLDYIVKDCEGDFWHKGYDTNVWHALYRRKFMIENKIFSPEVSYCEDLIVAQHAIICANRMMAIPDAFYCYRSNPGSVFHTEVGVNGRPLFDGSIYAGAELIKLSNMISDQYGQLQNVVKEGAVYRVNSFTKQLFKISGSQRDVFFNMVAKHREVVSMAKREMTSVNRWLLDHPQTVKRIPSVLYAVIKLGVGKNICCSS